MSRGLRAGPRKRLRDSIYESVRELVAKGALSAGQRLTEDNLAVRFGVSRTPVREALFQLAREGLLVRLERGYSMPLIEKDGIRERLEVRYLLDPMLASLVAQTVLPVQAKVLSSFADAARGAHSSGASEELSETVHRFHQYLAQVCTNTVMGRCCEAIENDFIAARSMLLEQPENRSATVEHLYRLSETVLKHRPEEAERESRNFISKLLYAVGCVTFPSDT